jgi:hypothetical protein
MRVDRRAPRRTARADCLIVMRRLYEQVRVVQRYRMGVRGSPDKAMDRDTWLRLRCRRDALPPLLPGARMG